MKQHFSVFLLMVRGSIYKVFWLLCGLAAADGVLLALAVGRTPDDSAQRVMDLRPESIITSSRVSLALLAAAVVLTVVLCRHGCAFGSRTGYRLRGLSVSHRAVFLWQAAFNTLCYALLLATQALVLLGFCLLFVRYAPEGVVVSNQTVFLAAWRSPLLHAVLPMGNWLRWTRNALLLLGLGATSAVYPFRQRRGLVAQPVYVVLAGCMLLFAPSAFGLDAVVLDLLLMLVTLLALAPVLPGVFGRGTEYEDA